MISSGRDYIKQSVVGLKGATGERGPILSKVPGRPGLPGPPGFPGPLGPAGSITPLVSGDYLATRKFKNHTIEIDESVSFLTVTVTFQHNSIPDVFLYDPKYVSHKVSSTIDNAVVFDVKITVPGEWQLRVHSSPGKSRSYKYDFAVKYNDPVDFDVRYFYQEKRNEFILVKKPLIGM